MPGLRERRSDRDPPTPARQVDRLKHAAMGQVEDGARSHHAAKCVGSFTARGPRYSMDVRQHPLQQGHKPSHCCDPASTFTTNHERRRAFNIDTNACCHVATLRQSSSVASFRWRCFAFFRPSRLPPINAAPTAVAPIWSTVSAVPSANRFKSPKSSLHKPPAPLITRTIPMISTTARMSFLPFSCCSLARP